MRTPDGREWVTVQEAASRLGVSRALVAKWVSRGLVDSVKVDRRRWVCFQDVAAREAASRKKAPGG